MSYDLTRINQVMQSGDYKSDQHRQAYSQPRDNTFPFLKFGDLPRYGEFLMRFLPSNPEKFPDGFMEVAGHWINPLGLKTNRTQSFQIECLKPNPCFVCDVLEHLLPQMMSAAALPPAIREELSGMDSVREMIFLISIFLKPHESMEGEKKRLTWGPEKDVETGAILRVRKPSKFLDHIINILSLNEDVPDMKRGRYLNLSKKVNQSSLVVASPPCEIKNKDILLQYPDMNKRIYHQKFMRYSYGEQQTALAGTWMVNVPQVKASMEAVASGGQVYSLEQGLTSKAAPPSPVAPPPPNPFATQTTEADIPEWLRTTEEKPLPYASPADVNLFGDLPWK